MKTISSLVIVILVFVNSSFANFSQLEQLLDQVTVLQKQLQSRCDHLATISFNLKNAKIITSKQLENLENSILDIHNCLIEKQEIADRCMNIETDFATKGYSSWVFDTEINVQGFDADFDHYKECVMFSISWRLSALNLKRFVENNVDAKNWGKIWLDVSPEPKMIKAYLETFVKEQLKMDQQYLIPTIKKQIYAHKKWISTN